MYAGRKQQRFPLAGQGHREADISPAVWKIRSRLAGLLSRRNTASHRCLNLARTQGAPPLSAPGWAGTPVWFLPPSGQKSQKNSGYPWVSTVKAPYELPPVALPTSGKGSKQLLPLSPQAPLSFALLWHRSTGLSRPFLGRRDLTSGKRRHILCLAREFSEEG